MFADKWSVRDNIEFRPLDHVKINFNEHQGVLEGKFFAFNAEDECKL